MWHERWHERWRYSDRTGESCGYHRANRDIIFLDVFNRPETTQNRIDLILCLLRHGNNVEIEFEHEYKIREKKLKAFKKYVRRQRAWATQNKVWANDLEIVEQALMRYRKDVYRLKQREGSTNA